MPLMTQIIRDGKPVELRWNGWHLQCMAAAITEETSPQLWASYRAHARAFEIIDELNLRPSLECTALDELANIFHREDANVWTEMWKNIRHILRGGSYELKEDHSYSTSLASDFMGVEAGDTLELHAGDVLWMNL